MLHRMLLNVALTFLLVFSQQSALLHGISHLAEIDPISNQLAQELTPEIAKGHQNEGKHHASHCDHCLGFSHLASLITSNSGLALLTTSHVSPVNLVRTAEYHFSSLAYSARAPPASI